jgi:hypothetical protein
MMKRTGFLGLVFARLVTVLLACVLVPPGILPIIEAARRWLTK